MPRYATVRSQRTIVYLETSEGEPFPQSALRLALSHHEEGDETPGRQTCGSRFSDPFRHPLMALASQREWRFSLQAHTALTWTHTPQSRENTIQSPPRYAPVPERIAERPR